MNTTMIANLVIFLCGVGVGAIFNEYANYSKGR